MPLDPDRIRARVDHRWAADVLGPGSNAHGPNEALHLPTARRITATVVHVLDAHAGR